MEDRMVVKKKKGIGLEWYLLILAFIFGLIGYYVYLYATPHRIIDNYIGKYQFNILKTNNKAESALFYIDQSAKYASQQAVYELAQNGGISEYDIYDFFIEHECGKFNDAYVWFRLNKDANGIAIKEECFDESSAIYNLEYYFNKNLNKYLENYPHNIIVNNYKYELKDGLEVIGKAKDPLIFYILKDETKPVLIEPTQTKEGLVDFTGTTSMLCKKGEKCQLTKEAYDLLLKAEKIAREKFKEKGIKNVCLEDEKIACLKVNSGYRSADEQRELFVKYSGKKPVCNPDNNEVCPHITGNAVDIVFQGKTEKTMTNSDWKLLHEIMTTAKNDKGEPGWVRYAGEALHFECCRTIRYAKALKQGVTAIG